jgi:hypothetical protein
VLGTVLGALLVPVSLFLVLLGGVGIGQPERGQGGHRRRAKGTHGAAPVRGGGKAAH